MSYVALDVATPKDALIAHYIIKRLDRKDIEYVVFSRSSTQTIQLLNLFGIEHILTGRYGYSLEEKYMATLEQERRILDYIMENGRPSVLWTHGNVAGVRTAYHLGIPIIYSNDTPHNEPVTRLTIPLATKLISPEAIPKCKWILKGLENEKIIQYRGTEEVTWVKEYLNVDRERILRKYIGEAPDRVIILRTLEYYASYSYGVRYELRKIVESISKYGKVVVIPRYGDERNRFGDIDNLVILDRPTLAVELIAASDMMISSGGTMAREAALLGIPSISYHFRDDIIKFLMGEGLPIKYIPKSMDIIEEVSRVMRDPERYRYDTRDIIEGYEEHIDIVIEEIEASL
ncbi:MAG TPA: DUF354 domain-containing protein [Thermoprotei archaeon]|nr:DUF354 domain-containing protein [Thermoprotei archaeon]